MPRPERRSSSQEFVLYQPKSETSPCGWAVHGRCSKHRGDLLVDCGSAREVHDQFGSLIAYQLLDRPQKSTVKNGAADAPPTATLLTMKEMDLIAGQKFRFGKSLTARMSEVQRISRVHPLTKKALPAEDEIERAAEKCRLLEPKKSPKN